MSKLETTFWEYNSRWFRFSQKKLDLLLSVEWSRFSDGCFGCNKYYRNDRADQPDKVRILISRKYRREGRTWKLTLLHEMAHFAVHGKDRSRKSCGSRMFNREMKRLARIEALNHVW